MRIIKNILIGAGAFIMALAVFLCIFVTISRDTLIPDFLGIGAYNVETDRYGSVLPKGSAAIVNNKETAEKGDIIVYISGSGYDIGTVEDEKDGRFAVSSESGDTEITAESIIGKVFYRINGAGSAGAFIRSKRVIVWAVMGVCAAAAAVWGITLPSRRRKAEVKELIELFDYYGRKFDEEEEGIDY